MKRGTAMPVKQRRARRAACMKALRTKRIEAEIERTRRLREECFAIELALYGPTAPSSSLNPQWFAAGGF